MFQSLDFVHVPAPDFDSTLEYYTGMLGAQVIWKVRGMETIVAALRMSPSGPTLLLSEHLKGDVPVLVYRVASCEDSVLALRNRGLTAGQELEIPHGPCLSFQAEGGQGVAICELVRPDAETMFEGRIDA